MAGIPSVTVDLFGQVRGSKKQWLLGSIEVPATWSPDRMTSEIGRRAHEIQTRWRPIDAQGNIGSEPAPENPDEPNEGETGPPEVKL